MNVKELQQKLDWLMANGISIGNSDIEEQGYPACFNNIGYCYNSGTDF
ncbi:MAG: hypothetical protein MJZ26_01820 [Fibrobacter sp.]|nr:hypothetical protein [Fibrobacter sp.]